MSPRRFEINKVVKKYSPCQSKAMDIFSVVTENENVNKEKSLLTAQLEQMSKIFVKLENKIKLLHQENCLQCKIIDQLKKLLAVYSKPSFVCHQHRYCKIDHLKFNWSSCSPSVSPYRHVPNQIFDEVDNLQVKYSLPHKTTAVKT